MQQDDRQSWFSKKNEFKKIGLFMTFDTEKGLFWGCSGVPVLSEGRSGLEETPGYFFFFGGEGRLRTHTGHDTSQLAAENVMGPGKNAKMVQMLPHLE